MKTIAYVKARDLIFGKKIEKRADGMVDIVEVSREEIRKLIKLEKIFEVNSLEYYPHDLHFIEHEGANYAVHFKLAIVKEPEESMLKESSIELHSKAVICAERYKQAAKAEEDLTAAFEALVKNHNEIAELERTIK